MSEQTQKTFEFKAEVKQLLNILVHSLYTNKEIFLRELISNSSDALDKLRFESTKGTEIEDGKQDLEIRISFDKNKNTVTISDTGIGMTSEELVNNIGTIAKSGSAEFIEQLKKNNENAGNIIGKFGVGFYSVFMVAERVEIKTKSFKKDSKVIFWESDGLGSYKLGELDESKSRGTEITIHLREDSKEYADKDRLERIIKTHSNFINFPIYLENNKVNTINALWREPKSSIKKEQYEEFYKFLSYDSDEPLKTIHVSVDAPIQFSALMFIPKKNYDLLLYNRDNYGLDLYVRRVLIQHQNKDLLPEYLSFVKGVVDSEDLPLNISRETLQEDIVFNKISSSVTAQVLKSLSEMADKEKDSYLEFWKEHGKYFKMGYNDYSNREKFSELLRFNSSISSDNKELISLAEYANRLKEGQKEIYYIFGNTRASIEMNPHIEIFKAKGIEVLYLFEPVDEFVMTGLGKYKDFELVSVDQTDLTKIEKFENIEEKKEKSEELTKEDGLHLKSLISKMKEVLGDKVKEVKESKRLDKSPVVLVNPDSGMSASMQKIMNMMNNNENIPQHIMEINPNHKLIRNLLSVFKKNSNDEYIVKVTEQLYQSSLLLEGYLTDPHKLVSNINEMLTSYSEIYISK